MWCKRRFHIGEEKNPIKLYEIGFTHRYRLFNSISCYSISNASRCLSKWKYPFARQSESFFKLVSVLSLTTLEYIAAFIIIAIIFVSRFQLIKSPSSISLPLRLVPLPEADSGRSVQTEVSCCRRCIVLRSLLGVRGRSTRAVWLPQWTRLCWQESWCDWRLWLSLESIILHRQTNSK